MNRNSSGHSPTCRFHQISDAYHVLSHPTERAKYDKQYHRVYGPCASTLRSSSSSSSSSSGTGPVFSGSHSSHQASRARTSGPGYSTGARPATGLRNNRSTIFSGTPPSYSAGARSRRTSAGAGAHDQGFNSAPHWDAHSHLRTQETLWGRKGGGRADGAGTDANFAESGHAGAGRSRAGDEGYPNSRTLRSISVANFVAVSSVVLVSFWSFNGPWRDKPRDKKVT